MNRSGGTVDAPGPNPGALTKGVGVQLPPPAPSTAEAELVFLRAEVDRLTRANRHLTRVIQEMR